MNSSSIIISKNYRLLYNYILLYLQKWISIRIRKKSSLY